jgi:hypothetical protein
MEMAACEGLPMENFFDKYLESESIAVEVARLCKSCRVKTICGNYGVQTKSTGVWGGRWLQYGKVIRDKELILSQYYEREAEKMDMNSLEEKVDEVDQELDSVIIQGIPITDPFSGETVYLI